MPNRTEGESGDVHRPRTSTARTRTSALKRVVALVLLDAAERLSPRRAAVPRLPRLAAVPRSPTDVDAAWLTAALCSDAPGAQVVSVAADRDSAGTTTRRSLRLGYNDAGAEARLPTRIFLKCTSTLAQRLVLGLGGLIDGEPGFYSHVRPRLGIQAPRGYFAAVDPRTWHSIVVVEDVERTRGARFWRPGDSLSTQQIEDLLGNVATWHAALWGSPLLDSWRWLKTPSEQMAIIDALIGLADRRDAGAARAREVIPASLRDRQAHLFDGMRRSMAIASEGPLTYLHGDLHVANTYLAADGAVGVCDWQCGLKGSWAHDFSYILATALSIEDRRASERDLLEIYLEMLASRGVSPPDREAAWLAYRQATLYPYFAWTYTLGRSRLQPRFQPDVISLIVIERIAAGIEDLGSLAAVGL